MHPLKVGLVCLGIALFSATSVKAVTFAELATKIGQIYDLEESQSPLYQTPGFDVDNDGIVDTLASLETKYANLPKDQLAQMRALLLCKPKPAVGDIENWGNLRKCLHASNIILARHHIFNYVNHGQNPIDKAKIATHLYLLATELDALSTGTDQPNIFPITNGDPPETYKLRDTNRARAYLLDTGAPKDISWAYSQGLLPRFYCTTLETPFDPGSNCKTINLWERIRKVMSAMATRGASEWLIKPDGTLRTEYWNSSALWDPGAYTDYFGNKAYWVDANTNFNPASGNGWFDLAGRRTMGVYSGKQSMYPGFFLWQTGGMADAAKLVLNEGGIYQTAYDFGVNAAAYSTAFDPANWLNNNSQINPYGYPVRALSNNCLGTVNMNAADPTGICEGGKTEFYRYWFPDKDTTYFNELTSLAYNGQHLLNDSLFGSGLPQIYQNQALNFYYAFKANFYKDGESYIDFSDGGFNETVIANKFPGVIGECHSTSNTASPIWFFKTPSNRLIFKTGETAAELISTFLPYYIQILATRDAAKATELTNIIDAVLVSLQTVPLRPSDTDCASGSPNAGSTNNLYARRAGHTADLLLSYNLLKQLPVVTLPKACDVNADNSINTTDLMAHATNFFQNGSDCTDDLLVNSLDYAASYALIDKPIPPAAAIPSVLAAPSQTTVANFDATAGDLETGNRAKVSVLSADGAKVYNKFYNPVNKIWDVSWTVTDIAVTQIGQQTGLTAIRSFNQTLAPDVNQPRQTIVATDGANYWIRFYNNGVWQPFVQSTTASLNLPNFETQMASYTMTMGDASEALNGITRAKIMVLSIDGTKIYSKYYDTNDSNQWDASWGTLTIATSAIGTQLGVTSVRSFTQAQVLPFNQPMQQALSIDGKTRYERFWTTGTWGSWKAYANTNLSITGTTPALLSMPIVSIVPTPTPTPQPTPTATPPPSPTPTPTPSPAQIAIAGYDQTQPDAETANRPKLSILSADGQTIYHKFHNTGGSNAWDATYTQTVVTNMTGLGQTAIRSFNQAKAPNGTVRQTVVSVDGTQHWVIFWNSTTGWPAWGTPQAVSTLNLPGGATKIAYYTMTFGDPETGNKPKLTVVSANGTLMYYKFNTGGVWDASWGTVTVANMAGLGQTAIRSFNQTLAPNGQPKQTAVSIDGRTYWVRYWNFSWGSWEQHSSTDLALPSANTTLLPMP